MTTSVTQATAQIYEILEPLGEVERMKVVRAALLLLGSSESLGDSLETPAVPAYSYDRRHDDEDDAGISVRGRRWMRQNNISTEMVEHCFHVAEAQVVADVPGASDREKTVNSYLLTGVAALLKTGEPRFDDTMARALCEHAACYDATNHSKYIKFGNLAAGDKAKGWTLLAPGLKAAASLVEKLAGG